MPPKKRKAVVAASKPSGHAAYACDNCGAHITLVSANCVTNSKEHLHACRNPECVRKLEERLGTAA